MQNYIIPIVLIFIGLGAYILFRFTKKEESSRPTIRTIQRDEELEARAEFLETVRTALSGLRNKADQQSFIRANKDRIDAYCNYSDFRQAYYEIVAKYGVN